MRERRHPCDLDRHPSIILFSYDTVYTNLVLLLFYNLWFNYEYWRNVSINQSIGQSMDSSAQQCKNI